MKRWLPILWLSCLGACAGDRPVVVGSKNFTEQVILGEMVAQLLEARDVSVDRRLNLGGTFICHRGLVSGDLDVYVEYTGTALTAILKEPFVHDPEEAYRRVSRIYGERFGLEWSAPLGFNNTFAIVMRPEQAERLGIRSISDLREHQDELRPGFGHEFLEREDGFPGLTEAYGLDFARVPRGIELGLVYQALMERQVDFVAGSATDGLIEKFDLVVLEDDRHFFPPYDAALVYRPEVAERYRGFREVVDLLEGSLQEETMRRLNRLVDDERRSAPAVVRSFLAEKGWLEP